MRRKIPPEAFSVYLGLGAARSYDAVAHRYGVTKRAVTNLAVREGWQTKLIDLEREARVRAEQRVQETLEEMNSRHLKTVQLIQKKALDALRTMPLNSAMDAVKALSLSVEKERLIRGEPTDRTALDLESVVRREYERWMCDDELTRGSNGSQSGKAVSEGEVLR
jgi:hypothetical protein